MYEIPGLKLNFEDENLIAIVLRGNCPMTKNMSKVVTDALCLILSFPSRLFTPLVAAYH